MRLKNGSTSIAKSDAQDAYVFDPDGNNVEAVCHQLA
jgi:hypothetical protein